MCSMESKAARTCGAHPAITVSIMPAAASGSQHQTRTPIGVQQYDWYEGDRARDAISRWKTGAGEGIRTLDPNLGKVVLYP